MVNPSLHIHRFCNKLELGEKTDKVDFTALRLMQCMKRDWMAFDRRRTELVGDVIFISAKIHNFKRIVRQIAETVHVSDETIRKD